MRNAGLPNFKEIEQKWQKIWAQNQTFKAEKDTIKPEKALYAFSDMFPYPSGARGSSTRLHCSPIYLLWIKQRLKKGFKSPCNPMGCRSIRFTSRAESAKLVSSVASNYRNQHQYLVEIGCTNWFPSSIGEVRTQ